MQQRRNSIVNAVELCLLCIHPSICVTQSRIIHKSVNALGVDGCSKLYRRQQQTHAISTSGV